MRALFDHAFRPAKIKLLDPFVEQLAHRLIDDFIDDGRCDWVRQFAVPLPLIVIGRQMGAPEEDIWQIKAWTDAWVQRLGMMQSEDEARLVDRDGDRGAALLPADLRSAPRRSPTTPCSRTSSTPRCPAGAASSTTTSCTPR